MSHALASPVSVQIESLPPLPAIAQRLLQVTESRRSSAEDVARVLRDDQAVTAKILRVVNSPFYGACRKITEVSRGVVRLGTTAVRNLVLGLCVRNTLMKKAAEHPEHASLWYHSIVAASACELIGRQVGYKPLEEVFVAGLLHDIGHLAMLILRPRQFQACLALPADEMTQLQAERATFGVDHADLGYDIMSQWRLPDALCSVTRDHHALQPPPEGQLLPIVMLADLFAFVNGYGLDVPLGSIARLRVLEESLGLAGNDLQHVFGNLDRRVTEAIEMLAEKPPPPPPCTQSDLSRKAVWLSSENTLGVDICQQLLEKRGYELRCIPATSMSFAPAAGDIVFVDTTCEPALAPAELRAKLASWRSARVVVMEDSNTSLMVRSIDSAHGFFRIPRLFTAHDIRWVEEQWSQ